MDKRYCVVTPYYKEDRPTLERCLRSVRSQGVKADHILVADGHPQDWLDAEPVRHIRLDRSHQDYGNMARGLGALMAVGEKYDGIAFLDADNWYDPDHIQTCLAAAATVPPSLDFVAAQRRFVRPDGSTMAITPRDKPKAEKVDTNCYFFLPLSYHLLSKWCTIPRELSQHGDELFYHFSQSKQAQLVCTDRQTVNYTCLFESCYRSLNEAPPPGAKPPVNWHQTQAWLASLSPLELLKVQRLTGLYLKQD